MEVCKMHPVDREKCPNCGKAVSLSAPWHFCSALPAVVKSESEPESEKEKWPVTKTVLNPVS